jgi:hypothetical protein
MRKSRRHDCDTDRSHRRRSHDTRRQSRPHATLPQQARPDPPEVLETVRLAMPDITAHLDALVVPHRKDSAGGEVDERGADGDAAFTEGFEGLGVGAGRGRSR